MKKLIRKVLIIMGIILLLFVLIKLYHFVIVKNMFDAIDEFRNEENRAYFVNTVIDGDAVLEEKVLLKEEVMKYITSKNDMELSYELRNFETDEEYFINANNRKVYINDIVFLSKELLPSISNYIGSTYRDFDLSEIFTIDYILLTKYNNKFCYKIITKSEIIIVDKDS